MVASRLGDGVEIHFSKLDLIDEAILKEGQIVPGFVVFLKGHAFRSIFQLVLQLGDFLQQFGLFHLAGKNLFFELSGETFELF